MEGAASIGNRWSGNRVTEMMSGIIRLGVALGAILVVASHLSARAAARKATPVRLSCDVYSQLERRCHCGSAENYFLGYGRKYCERSLAETGWICQKRRKSQRKQ
jgi:hypothetical protein